MEKLYIDLENCYGIPKFKQIFKFSEKEKGYLIYAPNGVMKTSFANTFYDIYVERESKDCFYPKRKTKRIIRFGDNNGLDLSKEDIFVIQPYSENYKSENATVLLADEELKSRYENIYKEINEKMSVVFSKLVKLSGKRKAESILASDFGYEEKNIYSCLEVIFDNYLDEEIDDYSNIKYGKLITNDSEKLLKNEEMVKQLKSYLQQYEKLLTESKIFKIKFNHNSADNVLKELKKDGFFDANHKVLLDNTEEAIGQNEFANMIENEKKRILDEELSEEFQKIDALLSSKVGTRALRDFIFNNKSIIPELVNLDNFKKKIWVSYLFSNRNIFEEAVINYKDNKKKLENIKKSAREQSSKWEKVVAKFNERFSNMPFNLKVENKEDVILKSNLPAISFDFQDRKEEVAVSEQDLIAHLSNGEKKALYLLNIIFEIEARKELNKKTFLIIDDVADSFDYRNKYAIIEYMKEIVEYNIFMPIILTHNFDFYRTVGGRLDLKGTSYFINRNDNNISLENGQYFKNIFYCWKNNVYSNSKILISSIAFVRNLAEYIDGEDNLIYRNLTNLLHYKNVKSDEVIATDDILVSNLFEWYRDVWGCEVSKFKQEENQKVIDLIFELAEKIQKDRKCNVLIENKIIMSIAIRQRAERYMVKRINDNDKLNNINSSQTRALKNLINFDMNDSKDVKIEEIIERVLIITSENIHINSFMYEPIVDMSLEELIKLYVDEKEGFGNI